MAKDKLKICVSEIGNPIRLNALNLNKKDLVVLKSYNCWSRTILQYYLKYSLIPGSDEYGYLTIDVSISKLINGDNAIPTTQTSVDEIEERFSSDLGHVLNFNNIPSIKEWTVSRDETYIDIIASKEIVESIYHIIECASIAYRNVDITYKENGSIYIHSGKDRKKANWTLILYDKGTECASRGNDVANLKNLKEGQVCLRLEIKTKRKMLRNIVQEYIESKETPIINSSPTSFKPTKIDYDLLNSQVFFSSLETPKKIVTNCLKYESLKYPKVKLLRNIEYNCEAFFNMVEGLSSFVNKSLSSSTHAKPTLSNILSSKFQSTLIKKILKNLHLFDRDIKILTKIQLLNFIKNSNIFKTKTMKQNAKKAIKILNGEKVKATLSHKTIQKYKNLFLNSGVHFLYTKHPIPEINQDMLDEAICKVGNLVIE
ncbi:MAG: phage/plasmid replication domain-containing protein [Sarcina sp.]